jgi:hypothetical protein
MTKCGNICVATDSDSANCGACGKSCDKQLCLAGTCGCVAPLSACGNTCVNTQSDGLNCGTCGNDCKGKFCLSGSCGCPPGGCVCPTGQSYFQGACTSTVFAACFNTGELVALDDNLVAQPASAIVGAGPQALAAGGGKVLVGDGIDNALYRFDPTVTPLAKETGSDKLDKGVNHVVVQNGKAYAVDSIDNRVQVIDLSKPAPTTAGDGSRVVDEIPTGMGTPPAAQGTNPLFAAFAGSKLYVTLLGDCMNPASTAGNKLIEIDLSGAKGTVTRELDFNAADYSKDLGVAANLPRPSGVAAIGSKVYVAIGNLVPSCYDPVNGPSAGPGYLAIVDTSADPMGVQNVQLPAACRNPYYVLASSNRIYVSCAGSYGTTTTAQEALVVLDPATMSVVNTTTFARCTDPNGKGAAACKTAVPGRMALHGSQLLIGDNNSGRLLVTDLDGKIPDAFKDGVSLCPLKCPAADQVCYQYVSDVLALQ